MEAAILKLQLAARMYYMTRNWREAEKPATNLNIFSSPTYYPLYYIHCYHFLGLENVWLEIIQQP